ncbi:transcription factor 7-like 1-A [Festucalex cinctus]
MANVEWDILFEVINADLNQQQVSGAPLVANETPVEVIDAQLFYELSPASSFVPPSPPPPKAPKRKRDTGPQDPNNPYIKKPPNAFMLFMKEQRPLVKPQLVNKDSATVNKILGQMWKSLSQEEQEKYFEESERLNLIHASTYPGWSCRDNYGKKKKRVWGKAATSSNHLTVPAPELPAQPPAPSTSICNLHAAPEVDLTSALFTELEAFEATFVPLTSSSPSGSTYTVL